LIKNLNKKILVVEDDAGIRDSLLELFENEGYEVFLAENGKRGLELMRSVRPFLVLLDLMMPVMDGSTFLADLEKQEDATIAATPIVLLTAAGTKTTAGCKVSEILTKPVDIDLLLSVAAKYSA
jgi:CheY-like chemotaxis protein